MERNIYKLITCTFACFLYTVWKHKHLWCEHIYNTNRHAHFSEPFKLSCNWSPLSFVIKVLFSGRSKFKGAVGCGGCRFHISLTGMFEHLDLWDSWCSVVTSDKEVSIVYMHLLQLNNWNRKMCFQCNIYPHMLTVSCVHLQLELIYVNHRHYQRDLMET